MSPGEMFRAEAGSLPEGVLFYPCSGRDWSTPLKAFHEAVSDFWFVDPTYRPDPTKSILDSVPELTEAFTQTSSKIWEPKPSVRNHGQRQHQWVDPLALTETLERKRDGRVIRVHLRRGYGEPCLAKNEFGAVSVFFYRGDSGGEGGSAAKWLNDKKRSGLFDTIMARIPSGGLLVTDGSNHRPGRLGFLKPKGDFSDKSSPLPPSADYQGKRRFTCIGRVDDRYGPTWVWRVEDLPL